MDEQKKYPYKLEFGQQVNGRSMPLWVYDKIPEGMRPITSLRELWYGRPFLYPSLLFPGEYFTGYMSESMIDAVQYRLEHEMPLYVKDSKR